MALSLQQLYDAPAKDRFLECSYRIESWHLPITSRLTADPLQRAPFCGKYVLFERATSLLGVAVGKNLEREGRDLKEGSEAQQKA